MDQDTIASWTIAVCGQRSRVQGLVLLIWDTLLTVDDESRLFWRRPITFPTCLFLWTRYASILIHAIGTFANAWPRLSDELYGRFYFKRCLGLLITPSGIIWLALQGWICLSIIISIETLHYPVILQLRVYALFNRTRKISILLWATSLTQVVFITVSGVISSKDATITSERNGNLQRCKLGNVTGLSVLFWVGLLILELVVFVLGLFKAVEYYQSPSRPGEQLHFVLLRDSMMYTLMIAIIYGVNIHCWLVYLPNALDASSGLVIAIPSTMACRMMINVRKVHVQSTGNFGEVRMSIPRSFPDNDRLSSPLY
ncbi:hypothetical protein CPB84DRAFT_163287 [Gymnopilus junonius]|uniref:DUF6533 domain-containing protein n=1 Tax=Gymnopilus junonius TaxID=109634 RepID=A0A9P5NVX7_GYMJU|nr:hypothetical protein CPB84DRAFT_163287 [Gymnopilus junonius]